MKPARILSAVPDIVGVCVLAMISGLGFLTLLALSVTAFDLEKGASVLASFLTHFVAAEPDAQRRVLWPIFAVWAAASPFVAAGLASTIRRKGAQH